MNPTLRNQIIVSAPLSFAAVALALVALFLGCIKMHANALAGQRRILLANLMDRERSPMSEVLAESGVLGVQSRTEAMLAFDGMVSVTVYDHDGNRLAHAGCCGRPAPLLMDLPPSAPPPRVRTDRWCGLPSLIYEAHFPPGGAVEGYLRGVYVPAPADGQKQWILLSLLILPLLVFLGIIALLNRRQTFGRDRDDPSHIFQTFIDTNDDIMIMVDTHQRIIALNQAARRWLGKPLNDLRGAYLSRLLPAETCMEIDGWRRHAAGNGEPVKGETRANGRIFETILHPVFDPDGKFVAMTIRRRDVSDRRRAQTALLDRMGELLTLKELSQKLGRSLSPNAIMTAAAEHAEKTLRPEVVVCFSRSGSRLRPDAIRPRHAVSTIGSGFFHRLGDCLCGKAAQEEKGIYSVNIYDDPRCTLPECKKLGIVSAAALPLSSAGENFGVMLIGYARQTDLSGRSNFLEAFSIEVAIALKNAYLYDRLKLSEKKFATIFRASPDAISISDVSDGTIVEVNDSFERITGWAREEVVGRTVFSLGLWKDSSKREVVIAEVNRRGWLDNMSIAFVRKSGENRWGLFSIQPIWLEGRRLLVTLVRDVTRQKRYEKALEQSQAMLDSIIRSIPDILYRLDPEGNIIFINDVIFRYGYTPEELIGCNIVELFHPEDRITAERQLKERRNSHRTPKDLALRLLDKDQRASLVKSPHADIGKPHIMLINASGIYEERETSPRSFKGTQGIARDITQLKDLEDRLRQAQKMEAIGTLSGGIAHDFNNILGGIIGYSELALDVLPQDARKLKKYLGRVLSSGRRAGDLVRQILQFAHRGERILAPTDIEPVVKETLELMRATLPKTIAIETEFSSDVGVIMADPTQIHQVLMNLFTNAFHAMRKTGGTLSVSMDAVTLTEEQRFRASSIPPGRYVRFSVADTGPGIPAEIQDRIFEPYFTTKEIGEGTGLGLSVSLGIIETHGGAIDVQSATGSGATFTVWLPAAALSASPDTTITAKLPRGNGQRILFVEDEPFFLDAITEQLESLGYFVKAAHDGRKALDLLQANLSAFDLVITDQTMPTITGIQLAGQIRNLSPDIPIILCTGYSETVTEETAARFGITKFLLKPIDRKELAVAVHHALNQTIEG